jgi:hypothetical protein
MKKVGAPGGFTPALKQLIDSATKEGKQIGAPKLSKVLHGNGLHLGQLKKADQKQLRDIFEHAPLTSKARALAEKLLQGLSPTPGTLPGVVKIKADLPTTTAPSTGGGSLPGVVKIKADLPTTTGPIGGNTGVVKIAADQPTTNTGINSPGVVKVKADLPTT